MPQNANAIEKEPNSILEYVDCKNEDLRRGFEEHIYDKVFCSFAETLPKAPSNNVDVWTDGSEILCRTESIATAIANGLDAISGSPESVTGYYNPVEDAINGEIDDHTGWWYVDFD